LDVPNVVRVLTVEEHEGETLLVMEYCAGGGLDAKLKEGPLPADEAVRIALEVLAALGVTHEKLEIVHRDIKPSNVLFTEDGHAKLGDFGLAQTGESERSMGASQAHPGTPGYKSPEQETKTGYLNPASDLYALGCVLFEMVTGKMYQRLRPGTKASSLRADVPGWLDAALAKALEEDVWDRYDTSANMASALTDGAREAEEAERNKGEVPRQAIAEAARKSAEEVTKVERCANCGAELRPNDRYCGECGLPAFVPATQGAERRSAEGESKRVAEDRAHRRSRTWVALGGVMWVVGWVVDYVTGGNVEWAIGWAIVGVIGGTVAIWRVRKAKKMSQEISSGGGYD
jgi:F0F1-type ATP synthase assembly protein I